MAPENLHTDILDNLQTATLLVSPDMTVNYLNSAAETLLKVSGSRVIGEPIKSLFVEKTDDEQSLFTTFKTNISITKREAQLQLQDNQVITVDCAVTPIVNDNQTDALVIELHPLDRLLRISREEGLLSSQQNSQALIRGLAHEIKNPLGGLRGAAQLLAKELPNKELCDYTNIIIAEADRLSTLVDSMLGSHDLLVMQPLNIHEVIERVKALIEAEVGSKISLKRDYDPSIPEITGDKERLIQAVLNITRNAMQALLNPRNQQPVEQPTISFKTRSLRQFTIGTHCHRLVCQLQIKDNGPGIPEDIFETIFLPMVSGRADGTGLGLSIAQSIIYNHQGLIECSSEPGKTVFDIYLPLETKNREQVK